MARRTLRSGAAAAGLAVALMTGTAGCTFPDVTMSPGLSQEQDVAEDTAEPAGATGAAATASAAPERPAGDLDTGSLTRTIAAGDQTVVVDYWTEQDAKSWTTSDPKTLQLAAHVEGARSGVQILVTRFVATADDGTQRTVAAEDRGEFALMPPFTYATAFTLPDVSPTATAVTLYVQFDLLVETMPDSGRYYRQTVLDQLELPLLEEDSL
ncbi:hypothetical protein E9549_16290 [Blastococcus sp. MG754426]|uniref:hypothetical protein n=1 Tax=unclassified Blastococcus TaxID=2619396 RepID=UPI001EF0C910|nr:MULTISPECIES: hypothetical protein [unclassified Blastococcus]MCF6508953.1 hypothetical protein [Blastococcus sp. MG754426]MCF6512837.1 hypothetical protein [Blastococcus sp. MG754427]MCF6736504.1 hypothetical protein [Blastococcus sp. KM273129]